MLTVYSSTSPGRVKRAIWPSMVTEPALPRSLGLGDSVDLGLVAVSFPLTPALSLGEREDPTALFGGCSSIGLLAVIARPTENAVTRKRSLTVPLGGMTIEVSHKPSRVTWPSSRWKTQRNRALPLCGVGLTAS